MSTAGRDCSERHATVALVRLKVCESDTPLTSQGIIVYSVSKFAGELEERKMIRVRRVVADFGVDAGSFVTLNT